MTLKASYVHATTRLSSGYLTEAEVQPFWKPIFQRALPLEKVQILEDRSSYIELSFPSDLDPLTFSEWNPAASSLPKIEPRGLMPIVLDCLIATQK